MFLRELSPPPSRSPGDFSLLFTVGTRPGFHHITRPGAGAPWSVNSQTCPSGAPLSSPCGPGPTLDPRQCLLLCSAPGENDHHAGLDSRQSCVPARDPRVLVILQSVRVVTCPEDGAMTSKVLMWEPEAGRPGRSFYVDSCSWLVFWTSPR